jgi:hypothetical protein
VRGRGCAGRALQVRSCSPKVSMQATMASQVDAAITGSTPVVPLRSA